MSNPIPLTRLRLGRNRRDVGSIEQRANRLHRGRAFHRQHAECRH